MNTQAYKRPSQPTRPRIKFYTVLVVAFYPIAIHIKLCLLTEPYDVYYNHRRRVLLVKNLLFML